MPSEPPSLPQLDPPPRFVPLGVRLLLLAHHSVTGTLWFTLPAAVMLLVAAISQLPRGARTALVVFGAVLLLLGIRMGLPPLRRGMRRVQRLATGTLTLGRIVSCHLEAQSERDAKPYAEFLRKYATIGTAQAVSLATGCAFKLIFVPLGALIGLMVIAFVITAIARLFNPAIDAGDMDFENFLRFCLGLIAMLVIVIVSLESWRKAAVPLVDAYLEIKTRIAMLEEDEYEREWIKKVLDEAAAVGLDAPLPERSDAGIPITCTVEYVTMGKRRTGIGSAVIGDHLNLAGVEPLLFDPANPGEVELFAGLSTRIKVKDGRWWPIRWVPTATRLAVAGGVMALDALVLLEEIVALVL